MEHKELRPLEPRQPEAQQPPGQLRHLVRIGLLPAQMQQLRLDVLVIERASPLDERLARERAAREVRRQHELPRKLLRVQLPRPVDDHAADAAAQTVRVLPQRAQQAHEGLIRAVGVDRDGEQQPPPGGGRDLLRRKLRDREFRQRRGQQALQPRAAADPYQRQRLHQYSNASNAA